MKNKMKLADFVEKHNRRTYRMNLWFRRSQKRNNDKVTKQVNRYVSALIFGHEMAVS
nr:MAG TPA: hypothetical protein [Caudoviricetes sp.]